MDSLSLKGENAFVKITLAEVFDFPEKTCNWGGYDVKANVEIKSGNFQALSSLYTLTGELFQFYEFLQKANGLLNGKVIYRNYEQNLFVTVTYDNQGHVTIEGTFSEENEFSNNLDFEFRSDQSYIKDTLQELRIIISKYGDLKGI